MYLQEIIEVAIGLIFAWLILSIAVLQIQEVIARLTRKRSNDLYNAIENMLNDPDALEEFYKHPLVESLKTPANGIRDWFKKRFSKITLPLHNPSYIPAETFARVAFDIVTKAGTKDSPLTATLLSLRKKIETLKEGDQKAANDLIAYLANLGQTYLGTQIDTLKANLKDEMIIMLDKLGEFSIEKEGNVLAKEVGILKAYVNSDRIEEIAFLIKNAEPYLDQVKKGALKSASKQLGNALNTLLAGAEEYATNADKAIAIARKNVETWFDSTMERVTGSYKRWAQVWAFVIGFILAVVLNVDSIYIAQELWRNPALRQASATYVQSFIEKKTENGSALSDTDLQVINDEIQELAYPVGWNEINKQIENEISINNSGSLQFLDWLWFGSGKLFGWLFTALAAMQGAPFWFDTLKKLVNVRSAGTNPTEKPKQSTSDKGS